MLRCPHCGFSAAGQGKTLPRGCQPTQKALFPGALSEAKPGGSGLGRTTQWAGKDYVEYGTSRWWKEEGREGWLME